MRSRSLRTAVGLLGAAALGMGCATVGAPPLPGRPETTFRFESGWGGRHFDQPAEDARAATVAALRDLQVRSLHQKRAENSWLLDGRARDGRPVRVAIQPTENGTQIAARVGRTGDPAFAQTLLQRVASRLDSQAAADQAHDLPPQPAPGRFARDAVPDAVMFADQLGSTYRDSPIP